jgi:hypothetical protein
MLMPQLITPKGSHYHTCRWDNSCKLHDHYGLAAVAAAMALYQLNRHAQKCRQFTSDLLCGWWLCCPCPQRPRSSLGLQAAAAAARLFYMSRTHMCCDGWTCQAMASSTACCHSFTPTGTGPSHALPRHGMHQLQLNHVTWQSICSGRSVTLLLWTAHASWAGTPLLGA